MKRLRILVRLAWRAFWPLLFLETLSFLLAAFLYPALDLQTLTIIVDLLAMACLWPVFCQDQRRRAAGSITGGDSKSASVRRRPDWREAVFLAVFTVSSCIVLNELINLFGISGWSEGGLCTDRGDPVLRRPRQADRTYVGVGPTGGGDTLQGALF